VRLAEQAAADGCPDGSPEVLLVGAGAGR
jgi:hypothetical protein